MSGCSKIRHIVKLRQMLRRWRKKAASSRIPSDVPAGHVAVTVGSNSRRFVVRATHLNHPVFKKLLIQAQEEFGFTNTGPLAIPCDESLFEDLICYLSRSTDTKHWFTDLEDFIRYSHSRIGVRTKREYSPHSMWTDARPLLQGLSNKSS